jgi:heat shock 70kDa protein 4
VRAACYDRNLGGRDMDWAIAQHLAEDFKATFKMVSLVSKRCTCRRFVLCTSKNSGVKQ